MHVAMSQSTLINPLTQSILFGPLVVVVYFKQLINAFFGKTPGNFKIIVNQLLEYACNFITKKLCKSYNTRCTKEQVAVGPVRCMEPL